MSGSQSCWPLRKEQLCRVLEHQYSSTGSSLLDPYLYVFWRWFAKLIPAWIAPNTLTVSGLAFNFTAVIWIMWCSPNAKEELSAVSILWFILSVFSYQTLDAIDGLHARQTKSCSPLGELFDHGCDAISVVLIPIGYFAILGFGSHPILMFIQFFIVCSFFYISHWQSYVTGVLQFDRISVTESLVAILLISTISSLFGVKFWSFQLPLIGLELKVAQFLFLLGFAFVVYIRFGDIILEGGTGKYGTTVANTSVLFPVCPLALTIGMAVLVATRSPTHIYYTAPCLFLFSFGAVLCKISQNLVIAHMSKSAISLFDTVMVGPFFLLCNQYFNCPLDELLLLRCCCIWTTADVCYFCVRVCSQLASFLNISVFRVGRPAISSGKRSTTAITNTSVMSGLNSKFVSATQQQQLHQRAQKF